MEANEIYETVRMELRSQRQEEEGYRTAIAERMQEGHRCQHIITGYDMMQGAIAGATWAYLAQATESTDDEFEAALEKLRVWLTDRLVEGGAMSYRSDLHAYIQHEGLIRAHKEVVRVLEYIANEKLRAEVELIDRMDAEMERFDEIAELAAEIGEELEAQ